MNVNSLMWAVFKPALKRKFGFKEINKVQFVANSIENTLDLIGWGYTKDDVNEKRIELNKLVLSKHSEYLDMFLMKAKNHIEYKSISVVYFKVDFQNKTAETDIFYINLNDIKTSIKLKLKL